MSNPDPHASHAAGLESPYAHGAAVTPSDTVDLATYARALYIGGTGSGSLKVTTVGGSTITLVGLTAGTLLPIRVKRVFAADTNVTGIVALW